VTQSVTFSQSWTTFSGGFGPAMASMRGDTVYEGSGQAYGSIRYTRPLTLNTGVANVQADEGVASRSHMILAAFVNTLSRQHVLHASHSSTHRQGKLR